ncbi:MAG: type I methionyl aminopeptidase [Bacteroidetes bacterium CG12_big_fil_rev_8_21_14_0_65_60_17]|nr:MAG: type I methionyl aminopeptidase [Bacteroidetes bacterium CG12_big_fil_rev_8_21_14_0_65_60_17]
MVHLKSEREVDLLREAALLVSRTLAVVAARVQPGATTRELDSIAEEFIRDHGAVPAFKGYKVGSVVFPATLCTSVNDAVVHGIPDDQPLKECDLLSVDCGVVLDGYVGDSAYTFAVGELSEDDRQLCTTTYQALEAGVAQAVAGNRTGDIGFAVQSLCEARGYGVVKDLVGHGVGRNLHEDPQIPNFGRRGTGRKLKSGLTICIEPMINRGGAAVRTESDGWTIRTADSLPSAHYEKTVVVRQDRPEVLTDFSIIEAALSYVPYGAVAGLNDS